MVTWTAVAPLPVPEPTVADERATLKAWLAVQRAALVNICAGLSAEQLARRALPPSNLSLLGLVRHMAKVERVWFRQRVAGLDIVSLYGGPGDPADFEHGQAGDAQAALDALQVEWQLADQAVTTIGLDHTVAFRTYTWSLRMVYLHMITEYARHNGHADLLRERIDGVTGR